MPSESIIKAINELPNKSIKSLDLIGHGNNELIDFGNDGIMTVLDSGIINIDGTDMTNVLKNKIMDNSKIILFGCNTAQGDNNFTQRLSKVFPNSSVSGNGKFVLSTHQFFRFYMGGNARFTFSNKTYEMAR